MNDMTRPSSAPRPIVLCILDGWGERAETTNNAIALADTPNWDRMIRQWPKSTLYASAEHVGLPHEQIGNSEVGHLNIGAGRVVLQQLPRIGKAIAEGALATAPALTRFIADLQVSGGKCQLLGLISPGGVHSHQDHGLALAKVVAHAGIDVAVHAFLDGRDTPPRSAATYMSEFTSALSVIPNTSVATIGGRYFAMDRDKRWDRLERAYNAIVLGEGQLFDDPVAAINASYQADVSDEFVSPVVIGGYGGMSNGDGVLMFNFRADRARQILTALADPDFDGFERKRVVTFAARLGMTEYSDELNAFFGAVFPPTMLNKTMGEVVADAGLKQLRMAETEKYAHVTFFFNGGRETAFDGEERILVPSPKVATYDLQPEMSAVEVTDHLVDAIGSGRFDLIIVNYANGDMVGHTGNLEAAMKAATTLDRCLGRVEKTLIEAGGVMLMTADHGNCELMRDPDTGEPHTAHTLNKVPILLVNSPDPDVTLTHGCLADVSPTLLELLKIPQPEEMTGRSLIAKQNTTV